MRVLNLLIIIVLFFFLGCEKDDDEKPPKDPTIIMDTLEANYFNDSNDTPYSLDVNGDHINDITFMLSHCIGGSYFSAYSKVYGINNSRIIYFTKNYTTWTICSNDTSFMYHTIKQVKTYNLNDTIDNNTLSTVDAVTITEIDDGFRTSMGPEHTYIDIKALIGKTFYIGIILETGYAWVKIKVLKYSKIVVLRYGYTTSSDGLVITE